MRIVETYRIQYHRWISLNPASKNHHLIRIGANVFTKCHFNWLLCQLRRRTEPALKCFCTDRTGICMWMTSLLIKIQGRFKEKKKWYSSSWWTSSARKGQVESWCFSWDSTGCPSRLTHMRSSSQFTCGLHVVFIWSPLEVDTLPFYRWRNWRQKMVMKVSHVTQSVSVYYRDWGPSLSSLQPCFSFRE